MRKELRLWSLFSFTFYAQCFLDAAVGAMNTLKAVSIDRYLVSFFFFFFWGGGGRGGGVGVAGGLPSLEHQLNFDIIMLIDRL